MDIKNTFLFCSIRSIVHKYIPLIYERINQNSSVFKKDIWEDLEQMEVIQQFQSYWKVDANLSNMVWDAVTLKPVGSILGRVCIEHYSHWNYISLSFYICNLLSLANNDFVEEAPIKYKIRIQDLNNKEKMRPYLDKVENFLYSFPELFLDNIKWINLNLESIVQNEKLCYIPKVNNKKS